MLVDPYTYGKQLEAYRRWIVGSAVEVVKARNASVPATRISADALEVIEFEIELAHVNILWFFVPCIVIRLCNVSQQMQTLLS
jgi:hypothetical protein